MDSDALVFLHLSDIHFKHIKSYFDLDYDLRHELEKDLESLLADIHHVNSIVITGDIVFSGKKDEYDIARSWIERVCKQTQCAIEDVWLVPGNHDVDRTKTRTKMNQTIHANIRKQNTQNNFDSELLSWIEDKDGNKTLLEPLEDFNSFAMSFGSESMPHRLSWTTDDNTDYELNDGSKIRIIGINSALISDDSDDNRANKLFISSFQFNLQRYNGVEYLLLCHHPPDWVLDNDFEDKIISRARILLFGHKHYSKIRQIENSLKIVAGAIHPTRTEEVWLPTYNVISLKILKDNKSRRLQVKTFQREWNSDLNKFQAKYSDTGNYYYEHFLNLDDWENKKEDVLENAEIVHEERPQMLRDTTSIRKLVYHFLSLPHPVILKIAVDLELMREEDRNKNATEIYKSIIDRAQQNKQLGQLWDNVSKYRGQDMERENPFNT